ncbi:MAG: UbiA family prenyltransferase [bacterium]
MSLLSYLDYIFVLRPLILVPVWDFFLIGNYLASPQNKFIIKPFLGLGVYTMLMGGIYILNQITDIRTDHLNKKLFIIAEGFIPLRNAYIEMFLLWSISLFLSFFFGIYFFSFALISLMIGILYSLPPIKLKGRPIFDTVSNGIGYGMINFVMGWLMQSPFEWYLLFRFLPYFLSISAVFINTTIVDIEGDKKSGDITTAVFLGERFSYILSSILMMGGMFTAIIQNDLICLIPAAVSLPLFIYDAGYCLLNRKINRKLTILSFRLPGLLFTIITCIIYPIYIPYLLIVFIGMKIYYKKRFQMDYPTLTEG